MIFVTVGSRNYPFDRLFRKLDELCEQGIIKDEIFAQTGTSKYVPKHYEYVDFLSPDEFMEKVEEASLVISHGASGSIMKALNAGKKVIAVTRLENTVSILMIIRSRIMKHLTLTDMFLLFMKWTSLRMPCFLLKTVPII